MDAGRWMTTHTVVPVVVDMSVEEPSLSVVVVVSEKIETGDGAFSVLYGIGWDGMGCGVVWSTVRSADAPPPPACLPACLHTVPCPSCGENQTSDNPCVPDGRWVGGGREWGGTHRRAR